MSKAYELGLTIGSFKNESTSTMPAYTFVRLCTTESSVDIITTKGGQPVGVTQQAINPSAVGPVAIGNGGGICRVKMASTALTTVRLATTPYWIVSAANGRGVKSTTSSLISIAQPMTTFAASDIVPCMLTPAARCHSV